MDTRSLIRGALFAVVLGILPGVGTANGEAQPATGVIAGRVTAPAGSGVGGVTVSITAEATAPVQVTTDPSGGFSVTGLAPASYTVTPAGAGLVMSPASRTVTVLGDSVSLAFTAVTPSFALSGRVIDANGSPLAGVSVALTGSSAATTTTDGAGGYRFTGLAAGATVTVTPAPSDFTFAPAGQTFSDVQRDVEAAPAIATAGTFRRYFAEGASNAFFSTTFALLNASGIPTTAHLRFEKSNGQVVTHDVALAGLARVTVDPATAGAADSDYATVVEASEPLVADRTMRWDATGYGSHAETSLPQPLTRWLFAEGSTTGSFNLFYLLQNPAATAAEVEVRYLRPAPAAPVVLTYTVAPNSRRTIYVNQEAPALRETDVSAVITSTNGVPIVAERAMYTNALGQIFGAGHESAGIGAPASQWFLAEGATGPFFNQFILVANPTDTAAPLDFRYLLTDGRVITKTHTVAANSRLTIGVHTEDPILANAVMSTVITSTLGVPVLVERAMWWPANGPQWYEAHDSAGATATGTKWAVADGESGGPSGAETYLLIANTALYGGPVSVTLVFEDGGTATRTFLLLPRSRFTVGAGAEFPQAVGRRFGAIVESTGAAPIPIVVERAMYASPGGVVWAAGSNLLATRLRGPLEPAIIPLPGATGGQSAPVTTAGVLGGDTETPAIAAIPDVVAERDTPVAEIATAPDGHQVARTSIEIAFARTATVAQVNAVLDAIAGRIVNAIAGVPIVVVRIPDPGTYAGLQAAIARTAGLPAVRFVNEVDMPGLDELPDTHLPPQPLARSSIDHLLAARAAAAWNARAALDSPRARVPVVLITDSFGAGPPNSAVNASFEPSQFSGAGLVSHGYHVLGIMAATFPGVPTLLAGPADRVVGLFPGRSNVQIFDFQAGPADLGNLPSFANDLVRVVRDTPGGVVVNSSVGFSALKTAAEVRPHAESWIEKVRTGGPNGSSLESRFVHAQAAGNDHGAPGALRSAPAAATTLPNLVDTAGAPLAHLTNTFVVENRENTPAEPFEPGCLDETSSRDGNIGAVGTDVFSLLDPGVTAGDKLGTSMASPLVAALAEYVWALDPTLSAQAVISRIRATARPGVAMSGGFCTNLTFALAPAIDAYAAMLAVDQGLASPLVRATLLDVADTTDAPVADGRFDQHDLQRFVTEIDARAGATFDYSRYDLNGDGRTGGNTADRFDLDANTPASWTTVMQTVEGSLVSFDETQLTDIQILCYYAYSFLYVGDEAQRTALLAGRCQPTVGARITSHSIVNTAGVTVVHNSGPTDERDRPNPTLDFVTPFEVTASESDSGSEGSASAQSRSAVDRLSANPDGGNFRGGTLQWNGSCTAVRNPATLQLSTAGATSYRLEIQFMVTEPHVVIDATGELEAEGVTAGPPLQVRSSFSVLAHPSIGIDADPQAGVGNFPFHATRVLDAGFHFLRLEGSAACQAVAAQPSTSGSGHAQVTFTLTSTP